jgi:VWFA-related protein
MRIFGAILLFLLAQGPGTFAQAQKTERDFDVKGAPQVSITNLYGKVIVYADETVEGKIKVSVESPQSLAAEDISFTASGNSLDITANQLKTKKRLDITVRTPVRSSLKIKTTDGEVQIAGDIAAAEVSTDTGTIATDVPLDAVDLKFLWTTSRPRYLSDVTLPKVEEKSGGRFSINGRISEPKPQDKIKKPAEDPEADPDAAANENKTGENKADKNKKKKERMNSGGGEIRLDLKTARGVILFNVDPKDIRSDLREHQLTNAAKAIIRSGDPVMTDAIRVANPKFFGEFAKTLPPRRAAPTLAPASQDLSAGSYSEYKRINVRVTDLKGRAISDLQAKDFAVTENNKETEVVDVKPSAAPFNLILLLDVSGSVEDYIDFIRKAARSFLDTAGEKDRISIVTFSDDVKVVSDFTTDRKHLSESLDTFDAGGGTAYYDALAYSMVDTLKPFRGGSTAIVILSDGDDNRSFLPFDSLTDGIGESGVLIYPLYVPSELIAAAKANRQNNSSDPIRTRYLGLTTRAEAEGAKLAEASGGVYYPIRQLSDLQKAYDDVVRQLRTSYTVTFRSKLSPEEGAAGRTSPRVRIKVNRENAYTRLGVLENVPANETPK